MTKKLTALLITLILLLSIVPGFAQAGSYWSEVKVTNVTDTTITVSWSKYANASQYQLYYGKKSVGDNCIVIKDVNATSWTITGLQKGTKYIIAVDVIDSIKKYHYYGKCFTVTTSNQPTPPPVCTYPITVRYYKDSISDANLVGLLPLGSAEVGTVIGNVDLTRFAPLGYVTPGTRSGDYVVAARENIVNVVYSKPQVKLSMVMVIYLKGSLEMITSECFETPLPAGTPVSALNIDRTKYAPNASQYYVPGEMIGDSVIQESQCTVLIVWYRNRPQ